MVNSAEVNPGSPLGTMRITGTYTQTAAGALLIQLEFGPPQQFDLLKVDGVGVILLDNMDCPNMAQAVQLRDAAGRRGRVELEASGGVTLETVRPIAQTGVDRIAVGAVTHSSPALDISLEVEEQ